MAIQVAERIEESSARHGVDVGLVSENERGFDVRDLIRIFDGLFRERYRTVLVRGEDEPLYLPRSDGFPYHRVIFAHGYFASALHEVAHWCIAGPRRRRLVDYGYWYKPDGRNAKEQSLFERVEVKPQALEWLFCDACGFPFRLSADNLDGENGDPRAFASAVALQRETYGREGPPKRARIFAEGLRELASQKPIAAGVSNGRQALFSPP